MIPSLTFFHVARFVLEAKTAVSLNSGLSDGAFDTLIVKDANNLPAIPGTSLAGVLRHQLCHQLQGTLPQDDKATETINRIFGFAERDKNAASRLHVSWGCIHDSKNKPVEGLILDEKYLKNDTLLKFLSQDHAMHRERVKITNKGVAHDGGKFDITIIPAGCRFSFEISYWSEVEEKNDSGDDKDWEQILLLLKKPLYLGSSTRSGLGLFECIELHQNTFNLGDETKQETYQSDFISYRQLGFSLDDYSQLKKDEEGTGENSIVAKLSLNAEDFWRLGHAGDSLKDSNKSPDATTLVEPVIKWKENSANFSPKHIVIPGSSVKGAINHRFQFHLNRLSERFIDASNFNETDPENLLFGFERNDKEGIETGQAGAIIISDLNIKYEPEKHKAIHLTHNSLDRYTGGVRDKVLYMEELIWKMDEPFELSLVIDESRFKQIELQQEKIDSDKKIPLETYKKALKLALDDLIEGRLALGAGSSKGHGYFSGNVNWSEAGKAWIGEGIGEKKADMGETQ